MQFSLSLVLLSVCLLVVCAQLTPDVQELVNIMDSMRNRSADPCTDFYEYACGTFVTNNPIPSNVTGAYSFNPIFDQIGFLNDELLKKVVNDPWPIINDLYESCMQDNDTLAKDFQKFYLQQVKFIESTYNDDPYDLMEMAAYLVNREVPACFVTDVEVNEYQQSVIYLGIGGNTLNISQYNDTQALQELTNQIVAAFKMFESPSQAAADAAVVITIEKLIASSNNNSTIQNITVRELSDDIHLDFVKIFALFGIVVTEDTHVLVENPEFILTLMDTNLKRFFEWKVYQTYMAYSQELSACWNNDEPSDLCQAVMSNSPYQPPWNQASVCRNLVHFEVQDLVGLIFTYEVISPQVSGSIRNMTTGIQQAFNKSLLALNWLDSYSLESVQFKLAHVLQIIGHPNVMDRYENVSTNPNTFFNNIFEISGAATFFQNMQNSLPFNRSDFEFDPMIINAFYDPSTNTINFPAGMLESPMFNGMWPKLFQYSRMGIVVGHENTHGFDNDGTYWNAFGLPQDILDNVTRANFQQSATCIADFYANYVVFGNTTIRGNQTLGENIADIGGIKNSFRAYQNYVADFGNEFEDYKLLPDLTTVQVYFLHYGQTWCNVANDEHLALQIQYDVHSPGKFRVNGPLSQFDEFAAAFNCPADTPMNPSSRCDLW